MRETSKVIDNREVLRMPAETTIPDTVYIPLFNSNSDFVNGSHDVTDIYLQVQSASAEELREWDASLIKKALVREAGLGEDLAEEITREVCRLIAAISPPVVTTSLIRELVDVELRKRNLHIKAEKQELIGIPTYDVRHILRYPNKENSNTMHNPENINLTLAELIIKQYALKEIYDKDVVQYHLDGTIHIHDLGMANRPYAFDPTRSLVVIKHLDNIITMNFDELWQYLQSAAEFKLVQPEMGIQELRPGVKIYIKDLRGWAEIQRLVRINEHKTILEITLENSYKLYVTEEHPCLVHYEENVFVADRADRLVVGQKMLVEVGEEKKLLKIVGIKIAGTVDHVYDITTDTHTLLANHIWVHNCSGQSPAYVAKFGLDVPPISSVSAPAKHPEVLIAHLLKMTSVLQNHFAGAIGWDAVNMFLAPYTEGLSYEDLKQLAQIIIFEFNQLAGGRGGQVAFTDINLYWAIPKHFRDVPAIGPGGKILDRTYGDYEREAQRFLRALFEVYMEGDAHKKPFFFPKPLFHINDELFEIDNGEEGLYLACEVASTMGNTYFVFDRGSAKLSECCRLQFELTEEDLAEAKTPWKMRYSALQNVSINLPRLALIAKDQQDFFSKLDYMMEVASRAHDSRRAFIKELLDMGDEGPLALLAQKKDGEPYLRWNKLSHLIGMVGLNEAVQILTGKQLHESDEAYKLGLAIIQYMQLKCDIMSEKKGYKIVLEQTPAESTAYRFARLDVQKYERAKDYVRGDLETNSIYYTNSTHIPYDANIDPIERVIKEGEFHPFIKAGAITHIWLGEFKPNPNGLLKFVQRIHKLSKNTQVAFSPEFTVCNVCGHTDRGRYTECSKCGSTDVDLITRITGYYTKVSSWNKGKKAELLDRKHVLV